MRCILDAARGKQAACAEMELLACADMAGFALELLAGQIAHKRAAELFDGHIFWLGSSWHVYRFW